MQPVTTRGAPDSPLTQWRHLAGGHPPFDPIVFDALRLQATNALDGVADAGRGNTFFFTLDGVELVLRHYRRGGLVRHISQRHYVFTGFERSRAFREFEVLRQLESWNLPAPRPFACQVSRAARMLSTASLVTYRLPGRTLAALLREESMTHDRWVAIGRCIATFHARGVCHADLNAHNILVNAADQVALIDFDRGSIQPSIHAGRWQTANLARLERSIQKICRVLQPGQPEGAVEAAAVVGWRELVGGYRDVLLR